MAPKANTTDFTTDSHIFFVGYRSTCLKFAQHESIALVRKCDEFMASKSHAVPRYRLTGRFSLNLFSIATSKTGNEVSHLATPLHVKQTKQTSLTLPFTEYRIS